MRVRNISKIVLYYVIIHRKHIGKTIVVHNLKRRLYHDKSSKPADLPIGVFLRNHVKGKIDDTWNPEPYKIVGQHYPDKHVYVAESLKRDGVTKTVNREHILHSRELVPAVETGTGNINGN